MLSRASVVAVLLALLCFVGALPAAHAAPLRFSPDRDLVLTHSRFYTPPAPPATDAALQEFISSSLSVRDTVQPETCASCKVALQVAEWIVESNSTMTLVEALGVDLCRQRFNDSAWCAPMVHAIVEFAKKIPALLRESALYEPIRFCSAMSMCLVPCCADDTTPEQITLNVGRDASQRHVSWVTGGNATASEVRYGLNGQLSQRATGYPLTMTTSGYVGTFHRVVLSGLEPNEVYSYQVGDFSGAPSSTSPVYSFSTWDPSALKTPYHIAVVGDMAADESPYALLNQQWLNNMTQQGMIDAVLHVGDLGYGDGYEPTFDEFFRNLQPTMTAVPFVVVPGNHEFLFNFSSYEHRFFTPGLGPEPEPLPPNSAAAAAVAAGRRHRRAAAAAGSDARPLSASTPSGTNLWHSWDLGCVHFIGLNSESALDVAEVSAAQFAWLQADLAAIAARMAAGRASHPDVLVTGLCTEAAPTFIVVYMHRPPYCSSTSSWNCGTEAAYLRMVLEPLFVQYGVDLVFTGHMHNYERTVNVRNEKPDMSGPVYVVNGAGGNREGIAKSFKPAPAWSAFRGALAGVGQLSIVNASALHLQFFAQLPQNDTRISESAQDFGAAPPTTLADDHFIYARYRNTAAAATTLLEEELESLVSEQ